MRLYQRISQWIRENIFRRPVGTDRQTEDTAVPELVREDSADSVESDIEGMKEAVAIMLAKEQEREQMKKAFFSLKKSKPIPPPRPK
ncbi:MAG: hypothetical protein RLZZ196_1489 [Bacteroidota bacterium]|jgi:acyl-CoA reductase-like NAD-dependent aldehyde dehydrogenase